MTAAQFWFDGEQFVVEDFDWDELEARWPDDVEKPNPEVAERTIREIGDSAGDGHD